MLFTEGVVPLADEAQATSLRSASFDLICYLQVSAHLSGDCVSEQLRALKPQLVMQKSEGPLEQCGVTHKRPQALICRSLQNDRFQRETRAQIPQLRGKRAFPSLRALQFRHVWVYSEEKNEECFVTNFKTDSTSVKGASFCGCLL